MEIKQNLPDTFIEDVSLFPIQAIEKNLEHWHSLGYEAGIYYNSRTGMAILGASRIEIVEVEE